ncbi:MAG: FGGY-family carbohydrate kinase [Caldilineaceae bacterium]
MHDLQLILAIDLGTSGCKVALVSTQGEIVATENEALAVILLPNGGAEQDPNEWWTAIKRATRRILDRQLAPVASIIAVCCTAQWSGTVPVDSNGNYVRNAIIWLDARGAPYVRKITSGPIKLEGYGVDKLWTWIQKTGGIPTRSGKDSIAHILYLKHAEPAIYQQAAYFLEPKDYVNLRLTGKWAASTESITLHWVTDNRNINHIAYDEQLLKLATLDRAKLPDLKAAVDMLGPLKPTVAEELGLSPTTQVVMGTPDIHSAAIGSGAVQDYAAHLCIGTSGWLACHVPFKKTDLFHNMAALPSALPGRYLLLNEQEVAGGCLAFLKQQILYPNDELAQEALPPDIFQLFEQSVAQTPAGSGNVIFTPWLNGERTPVEDHTVRGGFHNLSLQTTRAHLIRAVYEGVALNSRWLLGYVEQFIKRPLTAIRMIGGGAQSDVWCQIHADVLGRPIQQMREPLHANARGAALLAAVALGQLTVNEIPAKAPIQKTFEPNPQHAALYAKLFREFVNLYKSNRRIHARLNGHK